MGYYSYVVLAISANVDEPTYMVDGEEMNNLDENGDVYWDLEEFLSVCEPEEWHRRNGDYYFFWNSVKWYDDFDDVNYVERLTNCLSLNDIDYGYVIVGEDQGDIRIEGSPGMFDVYTITNIESPDDWDPEPTETPREFNEYDPFGEETVRWNDVKSDFISQKILIQEDAMEEKHTLKDWCILTGIDVNDPVVKKALNDDKI